MVRSRRKAAKAKISDYRHETVTRKNNPPAKIAAEGLVPAVPKIKYSYSPHLAPVLRFDKTGGADKLSELLEEAKRRPLTGDETQALAQALRTHEPWLEWAGKQEAKGFEVDPVALHIHERVSAQAILKVAARRDVTRDLFADPQQEYHEVVQFYQHDIDWTNRMILGDSLQVMASLARREDLAGKVQMIYIDPPYGIKFASNFQPEVGKRDVKDKESDMIREPEMVKAYRDTWHLGVHSYFAYLRDRLFVARELLANSGSIFVQISDENLHLVRAMMDEVFEPDNFVSIVPFRKTAAVSSPEAKLKSLASMGDFVIWYTRDKAAMKYRQLFLAKTDSEKSAAQYNLWQADNGEVRRLTPSELSNSADGEGGQLLQSVSLESNGYAKSFHFQLNCFGRVYTPASTRHWSSTQSGLGRVVAAERVIATENKLRFKKFLADFPVTPLGNIWADLMGATDVQYAVQTNTTVIERCLLMSTDPGDLVLDPTCGSGTTAYVAEQWGRRWITVDTSRVALAIARQRLLTAKYDYYVLKDESKSAAGGFVYNTVSHVTLKSIAQNTNLDPIFAKHEPILDERLATLNKALSSVTEDVRRKLAAKLLSKQKAEGKRAITDADRRRWELPKKGEKFEHWTVPFDTDPNHPQELRETITAYRQAWRAKMDEVNACIAANAEQEELVDRPQVKKGVVRVSGPFTMEAVQPPEVSLGNGAARSSPIGGAPEELAATFGPNGDGETEAKNTEAYLDQMLRMLRIDGVRFPNNKSMKFTRLEPLNGQAQSIHAEGRWTPADGEDPDPEGRAGVCVVFGPQYGPVTAVQVEQALRAASRRGYDDLVIAGFNFDGPAQAVIEEAHNPNVRVHMAHIRPDVNPAMNGLLKERPGAQLFTVFGQPRTRLEGPGEDGWYTVVMEGVDIYNPIENTVTPTKADKVAAWFIDSDYDGRTFCITQAFFPDRKAWGKLAKALKTVVDEGQFEALSGTISLPFPAGLNRTVAVKVIDPRGNEVMRLHRLEDGHGA